MNPGGAAMFLAIGFVPTLIVLGMVYIEWVERLGSVERFHR